MSWQDDVMIEQEAADALLYMGEGAYRDLYKEDKMIIEEEQVCNSKNSN